MICLIIEAEFKVHLIEYVMRDCYHISDIGVRPLLFCFWYNMFWSACVKSG